MNRLFLRVFLWFWLITAVVAAALVVTSPLLTRSHPGFERWQRRAGQVTERMAEEVAERIRRGELGRLSRHHRRGRHAPFQIFVLGPGLDDMAGRPVPAEVRELAAAVARDGEPRTERSGSLYLSARPAVAPDGRRMVVVATGHRPPRVVDLLEPRFLLPRLAVLLLLVGVLSLVLARRLTAPLETLREATRRLASADLEARVGPPLTQRRDELGDLARDFDAMAGRLQSLLEGQRRLLRDVSHELRSPLARLGVALELARRGDDAERREALDRIELEAERLNRMIGQLLTLSRLESGTETLAREELDLEELVASVARDAGFEARQRGVTIRVAGRIDCGIHGSPDLLRSAVENVLRNAIRYSPPEEPVEVILETDPGPPRRAVVTVRDRGPGVPADDLPRLFEPFFRTGSARDRASGGTGLGLAITAAAVRAHGGSARAVNREEGGLEVRLELPCTAWEAGDGRD